MTVIYQRRKKLQVHLQVIPYLHLYQSQRIFWQLYYTLALNWLISEEINSWRKSINFADFSENHIFFTFPCFQSYWVFTCDLQYFCKQTAATTKCKQIRVFRRCLHYRTSDRQASGWPLEVRLYGKIGIITAILRFSYSTLRKLVQVRPSLIWYRFICQRWKSKWQLKQV